jgi:hypothetical protein
LDQDLLAQSSVYLPGATEKLVKEGKYKPPPGKRQTVVRKGGGKTWEDTSLLEWDPSKSGQARSGRQAVMSLAGAWIELSYLLLSYHPWALLDLSLWCKGGYAARLAPNSKTEGRGTPYPIISLFYPSP